MMKQVMTNKQLFFYTSIEYWRQRLIHYCLPFNHKDIRWAAAEAALQADDAGLE